MVALAHCLNLFLFGRRNTACESIFVIILFQMIQWLPYIYPNIEEPVVKPAQTIKQGDTHLMNSPTVHPCWSGIFPGLFSLWRRAPVWGYRGPPAPQLWPRCLESWTQHSDDKGDSGEDSTQLKKRTHSLAAQHPDISLLLSNARYPSSSSSLRMRAFPNKADCWFCSYKSDHAGFAKSFLPRNTRRDTSRRWLNSCQQQIGRGWKCREAHENRGASLTTVILLYSYDTTSQLICTMHVRAWGLFFSLFQSLNAR